MDAAPPDHRPAAAAAGRVLPAVTAGVLGAVLVAALLLAGVVPALLGGHPVAVDAVSAESDLAAGALVVVHPAAPEPGDVIAIAPGPQGVRGLAVVSAVTRAGEALVTGADGRTSGVPDAQVEGVYLYGVPWVGGLWSAMSTPSGMFFLAALLLLLVAAHQLRSARRRTLRPAGPDL